MPFRHVTMFRWAEHVDADHVQRVRDAFDRLATRAPGLRHHAHGVDVGTSEGSFDYLVVADFDSIADWRAYRDDPTYVLLVEELIAGYAVDRATSQIQLSDERSREGFASRVQSIPDGESSTDRIISADAAADDEMDAELLARARRAALAEMQAFLAEPDDLG